MHPWKIPCYALLHLNEVILTGALTASRIHCRKGVHQRFLPSCFCFIPVCSFTRVSVIGHLGFFPISVLHILLPANLKCFLLLTSLLLSPQTGFILVCHNSHTLICSVSMVLTRHTWLSKWQVKVIKIEYIYKLSSLVTVLHFKWSVTPWLVLSHRIARILDIFTLRKFCYTVLLSFLTKLR